jgi:protein-L-isoaspartate(D-aspartate) O-methyltransferase
MAQGRFKRVERNADRSLIMNYSLKPEIACERLIKKLREKGIVDEKVLEAFRKVPRHLFVDSMFFSQAYDDNALPLGNKQTISQPYVVALMTQLLSLSQDDKILEIGTGSGFQTAILAQFSRRVYTIERNRDLGDAARKRLRDMGYENIVFKVGDGSGGWPQHAPFDRIIVTAGAPIAPPSLAGQLAERGIMVVPAGDRSIQDLEVYEKTPEGLKKTSAGGVVFVPLIGDEGWGQ